ncbi:hypothetical protein [Evansella tamaricis]|uniref:Uncharacterized protein n=1 Tax=Evansella tamaricis TaxID=2069301 RepID=A0ABS6JF72_9BACI|nr:hypothetical protein [Evansella tamaricis]MBU9711864.1 hypothetical protein [Evansella tamaricis]
MPDGRTGRPNIGHATGRGVLPDGRIQFHFRAKMAGEETSDKSFCEI